MASRRRKPVTIDCPNVVGVIEAPATQWIEPQFATLAAAGTTGWKTRRKFVIVSRWSPIRGAGMVDFRHLSLCFVSAALVLGAFSAASRHAQAQNLVQNPNFFNGLTDYTTTADSDENVFASSFPGGPTNPAEGGTNAAEGDVSDTTPAVISQSLTTMPNTLYLVTFAYAVDPSSADSLTVTFGNQTKTFTTSISNGSTPFDVVSFTATSSSADSTLTFTGTEGAFAVSELDVEAGPAPVAGGGALSFALIAAGFAGRQFRRRRPATSP